jgi:hypothetical protein
MIIRVKDVIVLFVFSIVYFSTFGQRVVTVKVVDAETKKPIKEAKVTIKGTEIKTVTNYLGFFQLTIDSIDQILVESEGYETGEVKVPALETFQISLTKMQDPYMPRDSVFYVVEDPASFPGGIANFYDYLMKNLKFPKDAKKNGIHGKLFVEFVVDATGAIPPAEIKVLKSLCESCDQEAIRVIAASPRWNPGKIKNIPVRQKMVLPVIFN